MSLYPTLEDMQYDKTVQSQRTILNELIQNELGTSMGNVTASSNDVAMYPSLGNFLGLDLTDDMIRANMPEYISQSSTSSSSSAIQSQQQALTQANAPITGVGASLIPSCAQVNHAIRELTLCKDAHGKIGLRVQSIDNGIFVSVVVKDSPAAMAGLRFGDQILQLNGNLAYGLSVDKIHKMFQTSGKNNISVIVRDRPFERTVTLVKDSKGCVGFQIKNGQIVSIVKDSSAARNGVLINHNLLEVNGQNVVAMKDKAITKIITDSPGNMIKITIIPTFMYDHLVKKLSTSYLRGILDHSAPDL